jgi:hypothetical protein
MTQLAIRTAATTAGRLPAWPESKRARHNPRPPPDLGPSSASRTAHMSHSTARAQRRLAALTVTSQLTLERYSTITN